MKPDHLGWDIFYSVNTPPPPPPKKKTKKKNKKKKTQDTGAFVPELSDCISNISVKIH